MLADDLLKAQICERDGIVYAAGLSGGYAYFEWSQDSGATKALFPEGTTATLISSEPVDDDQPAVEALQTGEIVVALTQDGRVKTYVTRGEGQHWDFIGAVE
jgi:predicted glutamine amidotransferase